MFTLKVWCVLMILLIPRCGGVRTYTWHRLPYREEKNHSEYDGTLVYSNEHSIDSMLIRGRSLLTSPIPSFHNSEYLTYAAGLTIDYESGRIIYGDRKRGTISSVSFDGTGHFVLASGQGDVIGIEFDPVERILYWVYRDLVFYKTGIHFLKLTKDGHNADNVKTLLKVPLLAYVTSIAVDSCGQKIFWGKTSILYDTAILKTDLKTSSKRTIISTGISRPSSLTVDRTEQRLYWSDEKLHKIERCDYDGKQRVIIMQGYHTNTVFGIAVYGDYLYYTDWNSRSLYRAEKGNGRGLVVLKSDVSAPQDVVVIFNNTKECYSNIFYNGGIISRYSKN